MKNNNLDFFPEVYQAVPGDNYIVYAYMNDGSMRAYDVKPLINKGGVFKVLRDVKVFCETLTVLNNTIAWDLSGKRDECDCIDVDPFEVYSSPIVDGFQYKS